MDTYVLRVNTDDTIYSMRELNEDQRGLAWEWIDITVEQDEFDELELLVAGFDLDRLSLHDAVFESNLPKVDDLGNQIHVVLHDLISEHVAPCVLSCFLTETRLLTIHTRPAPALMALHQALANDPATAHSEPDEVLAALTRALGWRQLGVLDAFEARVEGLVAAALAADPAVVGQIMAIRSDIATVRRTARPQREAIAELGDARSAP